MQSPRSYPYWIRICFLPSPRWLVCTLEFEKNWSSEVSRLSQRARTTRLCARMEKSDIRGRVHVSFPYHISFFLFLPCFEKPQLCWHVLDLNHFFVQNFCSCLKNVRENNLPDPYDCAWPSANAFPADTPVSPLQSWHSSPWGAAAFQPPVHPSPLSLQASSPLVFISCGQIPGVKVL